MLPTIVGSAATRLSDADMQRYLKSDRTELALLNSPVFFFGQNEYQRPCIPTWAYEGTPTKSDSYEPSRRTKPAKRCTYSNVGCECRKPGVDIVNRTPAFPLYFTIRKCSTTEIRVTLNLFNEKDGAICYPDTTQFGRIDVGHDFDWEGVVIVYERDPDLQSWSAEYLLMSQHGYYEGRSWLAIRNTLSPQQAELPDPRHIPFRRGQDHPVIYIGWLKHAHFDFKYTFDAAWPWQLLNKWAFRSDDWWQLVSPHNLLEANISTVAGRVMQSQDWGHATSIPPKVDQDVCSVPLHDGQIAMNRSNTVDKAEAFASGTPPINPD